MRFSELGEEGLDDAHNSSGREMKFACRRATSSLRLISAGVDMIEDEDGVASMLCGYGSIVAVKFLIQAYDEMLSKKEPGVRRRMGVVAVVQAQHVTSVKSDALGRLSSRLRNLLNHRS